MEHEYQDLVIKTEFLKASKIKIKKDIEFYKTIIDKVVKFLLFRHLCMIFKWIDLGVEKFINKSC